MGLLNLYVAYNYSRDMWVIFKLFGGVGLMLVFVVAQGLLLSKHVVERDAPLTDTIARMRARLAALEPESLQILDQSAAHAGHAGAQSGGGHYQLTIVARAFEGKPLLARHRLIYQALNDMMRGEIHALSIDAFSPDQL